ncbi:MAG: TlpA family protein disulfide reductase [Actinomycetia bacterium]|nr:TlpA family protein disulfide reductase [Actinomycetes bacterium]
MESPAVPVPPKRVGLRNVIVIALTTIVIVAALLLIKQPWKQAADTGVTDVPVSLSPGQVAPTIGALAPDFAAAAIDGTSVRLSDLRGEPVWLLFGATWCTSCRAEAADVQALSQAYEGRVHVLAVYVQEDQPTVSAYAQRTGLTYPQVVDPNGGITSAFAVTATPTHFFLDAGGVIRQMAMGSVDRQSTAELLDWLLAN